VTDRRVIVDDQAASRSELDVLVAMLGADARDHAEWRAQLPQMMATAVETAIRKALSDQAVLDAIHGHLARKTRQSLAEWVFDRLTTVVASLVLAASLTWYVLFRGRE
jgi:hypothetical protein